MKCTCKEVNEINGADAKLYAQEHLTQVEVNGETWEVKYKCSETGIIWVMDFPFSELQGGGPPRLRKMLI